MELKNGYPYWLIKNGLPYYYPRLLTNASCDVAIIGAGISGALAAYCLTQNGLSCILLDRRAIGLGSTCASTSLVQYELDKPLCELRTRIGTGKADKVYSACAQAVEKLWQLSQRIGFKGLEKSPSLFFSHNKASESLIEKEYRARKAIGLEVSLLDKKSIQEKYGFSSGNAIESALGLSLDAYLFSHTLCRRALNKHLQIYDCTEVIKIEEHARSLKLHTAQGARVSCRYLVNASGYEAGDFVDKKLVNLSSTYALASEHMDDPDVLWTNRAMLWNTADPYLYIRLTTDHRIIVGGRDEALHKSFRRDGLIKSKTARLARDFKKLFPAIDLRPEFSWAGTFGSTKDAMPYIGTITKHPRIYYALGYGGNGILFSHMAAEIITDAITGKKNEMAPLFAFDRA
jgi:glycine/D-amino acid oxidase-like deaminating enzyme